MTTTQTGRDGEELAARYLEQCGLVVMERNYRFEQAEVDIICFEPATRYETGGVIVFVEVKTRSGSGFGDPEESVSVAKQRKITHAARAFLYERQLEGSPCRFDVVAVHTGTGEPRIRHIQDAFSAI